MVDQGKNKTITTKPKGCWFPVLTVVGALVLLFNSCKKEDHVIKTAMDIEGNVYRTVKIGKQEWLAVNLRTTTYNDGTPIPNVTSDSDWSNLTSCAYAWYENNEAAYKYAYGALYNWYAIETGNLCPTGWRVPTDADWTTLIDYAGGEGIAAGKLKSTRTEPHPHPRWRSPNTDATNEYGFYALPGGSRAEINGTFYSAGISGFWWSSTETFPSRAWYRSMFYGDGSVSRYSFDKKNGFSVRCIKDK